MLRCVLALALVLSACSSKTLTTPVPPPPSGQASADLRLNAQKNGTFSCSGGLFFVANVLNQTNAALRVDTLSLAFTKVAGSCANHSAPLSPNVDMVVPPGISTEIRRADLAGDLCEGPFGEAGCEWLAKVSLSTSFGVLTDEIAFATSGPPQSRPPSPPSPAPPTPTPTPALTCGNDHPTILSPTDRATLSGSAPVVVRLAPDDTACPITLRSFVKATPVAGGPDAYSSFIDIGETLHWNTTASANGHYRMTAQKACGSRLCGGISDPIEVTVQNR
jgi:hypothetical protein